MTLYYLDPDPVTSARWIPDQLATHQLRTACVCLNGTLPDDRWTRWTHESLENYVWVWHYANTIQKDSVWKWNQPPANILSRGITLRPDANSRLSLLLVPGWERATWLQAARGAMRPDWWTTCLGGDGTLQPDLPPQTRVKAIRPSG